MIVTIDGPAGTGKSTAARRLAERLEFRYLDTGAMYRAIALACLRSNVLFDDEAAVAEVARQAQLNLLEGLTFLAGEDVTSLLRTAEVTAGASLVAQNPEVREHLVRRQQELARSGDWVCEGRDQGTVVFPHAQRKFFLTASPEIRAERRRKELLDKGIDIPLEELLIQQTDRDDRDTQRATSPLRPADDATIVDTTGLDEDAVIARLEEACRAGMIE